MSAPNKAERPKGKRGFASMAPGKQREIASKGGRTAHELGRAHEFTPDEARVAGRKGGTAVSQDRAHMAKIGRLGGHARGGNRTSQAARETPGVMTMTYEQSSSQREGQDFRAALDD